MHPRHVVPTAILAIVLAGCAASPGAVTAPTAATASAPAAAEASPPTACFSLIAAECERVRGIALSTLAPHDPAPVYVQVGPFGCPIAEGCPGTLAARPEGDVTIELPRGEALNIHVTLLPDGSVEATRGESFGVAVEPASVRAGAGGPAPYTLGHCGLFSGIDFDGSFWDPVGLVDGAHTDAINAADGVITLIDPDHGSFVSRGGLTVQLRRHAGAKQLPMCM